jgi:hypothetical protein
MSRRSRLPGRVERALRARPLPNSVRPGVPRRAGTPTFEIAIRHAALGQYKKLVGNSKSTRNRRPPSGEDGRLPPAKSARRFYTRYSLSTRGWERKSLISAMASGSMTNSRPARPLMARYLHAEMRTRSNASATASASSAVNVTSPWPSTRTTCTSGGSFGTNDHRLPLYSVRR